MDAKLRVGPALWPTCGERIPIGMIFIFALIRVHSWLFRFFVSFVSLW